MPLCNRWGDDVVVQQSPLPQEMFFELLHVIDPRTVDPLLKDSLYAVVYWIQNQIWWTGWPCLFGVGISLYSKVTSVMFTSANSMISTMATLRHQVGDAHEDDQNWLTKLRAKNYKALFTFVKVIAKSEWQLLYLDTVYIYIHIYIYPIT